MALGSYTRRILATAQILARIDHPGVVSIVDAGLVADGRPYVVTELDEGVTLAERVQDETPIEHHAAVTILRGICAALMAAHEVGVAHGSLDLDHVFLTEGDDRFVKLLDWGVERAVFDEARRAGLEPATNEGCTAPEQVVGIVSPQTDAYALGVVAYQLLFGRAPFDENSVHDMRAMHSIPPALEALLLTLMAPDPRSRPSIREAADRLAAVARDLEAPSPEQLWSPSLVALDDELVPDVYARAHVPHWVSGLATAGAICALLMVFVIRRTDDAPADARASLATAAPAAPPIEAAVVAPPRSETMPAARVTTSANVSAQAAPPVIAAPKRHPPPQPKPAIDRPRDPAPDKEASDVKSALLTQYQRIGHDLIELRKQRGAAAIADLWQRFGSLKIHYALATAKSRAEAAATLEDLRAKIDRNKSLQPSAACLQNPLADGCR